ncbi:tRNA (adenosine(37)-N6)-threonylcarbamoyltransferase complex dimerization subunit type 1 TsaB [Paenibacillus sp. CMAA1364]
MNIVHTPELHMRILALDTSTTSLTAAVMVGKEVKHEISELGERNHSIRVLSIVDEVLKASGTLTSEVEGIAVGIGPGSYTGTRIAVTAAKTLAWALKTPIVGISSLHALAYGGYSHGIDTHDVQENRNHPEWVIPLMDARRGQVFTALFSSSDGSRPSRLEPDAIRLMETWIDELVNRLQSSMAHEKPRHVWFVGDVQLHREAAERLEDILGEGLHIIPYDLEARYIGMLGEQRFSKGEVDNIHTLVPNYTQLTEAEVNLLRKP